VSPVNFGELKNCANIICKGIKDTLT